MIQREEQLGKFKMGTFESTGKFENERPFNPEDLEFKRKLLIAEQKQQEQLWEGKEIMPFGFNIMIRPTDENPYLKKVTDSGLITDSGGFFENPDTGNADILERGICYAVVEQVGPDVKHVRKGDEVIYLASRLLPLPFKGEGFCMMNEGQVLAIIGRGEKLEERFKNVSYGK